METMTSIKFLAMGRDEPDQNFSLHHAAYHGDLEKVKECLDQGMPIDGLDSGCYTPLHWAAVHGQLEVVEFLISRSCNLDIKQDNRTAVWLAAYLKHKRVVHVLLRANADTRGCSIEKSMTLLHLAVTFNWIDTVEQILKDERTNLEATAIDGRLTPLSVAIGLGHLEIVKLLIKAGANANGSSQHWSGLHAAAFGGNPEIVKCVLETGHCDIDAKTIDGGTALHLACMKHHSAVVKLLQQAGASTTILNNQGKRALEDLGHLHDAVSVGDTKKLKFLIELGMMNIEKQDGPLRNRPLHIAAQFNQVEAARILIDNKCDIDPQNKEGLTPLMYATGYGYKEMVDLLKDSGADPDRCSAKDRAYEDFCSASKRVKRRK